jgi:arylformamidase
MKYIDVTVSIHKGMTVWPGDVPVEPSAFKSVAGGDGSNVTRLTLSTHAGSHVDAPLHFGHRGSVDRIPPDALLGPCTVVTVRSKDLIRLKDVERVDFRRVRRVLFKTSNSKRAGGPFRKDYVALSPEVAERLVQCRVRLVGIDGLSVDPFESAFEVHHTLLGAGVVILENIDLSRAAAGTYELFCLPLKIAGGDGAPARAVLRKG